MNSRFVQVSLIILVALTLIALITFFLWQMTTPSMVSGNQGMNVEDLSSKELLELSVDTEQITTNLYTNDFIIVQFNILVDNKKARKEVENRMSEIRSAIISVLASKTPEDLQGEEGISALEEILVERFNEILNEGSVVRVLTIDRQIQS